MKHLGPISTVVEVAPAGWRGRLDHADRLLMDRAGVQLQIGRRSGAVPAAALERAEVWRGSDGIRRYRLLDAEGERLAVLHDQAWRLPGGRLSPLLEGLGCRVTTVDAPEPPQDIVGQEIASGRSYGVRGRWVVSVGVALLVVATAALGMGDPGLGGLRAAMMHLTTGLTIGLLVLAGSWWATTEPTPQHHGARPRGGSRSGWLLSAGVGVATDRQDRRRVVVNDGWGRVLCMPSTGGPLAPQAVACGADAAVILDGNDSPLLRLPVRAWCAPDETVEGLAARVAQACQLSAAERPAPAGGDELTDPEPPSLVLPTLACLGLATPLALALAFALLAGLVHAGRWSPQPTVWVPAALGLLAPVGVLAATLVRRARRACGSAHRAVPVTATGLVLTYPLWAGLGVVALPLLTVPIMSPAALRAWNTLLLGVGILGVAILLGARTGGPRGWRAAVAVVPVASGPLALGGRDVLPPVLLWGSVAVALAGMVLGVVGAPPYHRRAERRPECLQRVFAPVGRDGSPPRLQACGGSWRCCS